MAHLRLAGTTEDGRLLLVDDAGGEHTLTVDGRLRSAVRGDTSRLGQLEIPMDSSLRPRDIQARIRAGESAESVADAAGTSVDKIMGFAGPVLAEREHVAQRAQSSSLRRPRTESSAASRTLGDAVATHLRAHNVDPASLTWDAWRREDGRWTLTATFSTQRREGVASFSYDMPGSYVTLDDDDARWLTGELVEPVTTDATPDTRDDLQAARSRRLEAVPGADVPLGDDAIDLVAEPVSEPVSEPDPVPDPEPEPEPGRDVEPTAAGSVDEPLPLDDDEPSEPPRRPVTKKRGRASVPSWDEIMFGGHDQ